MAAASTTSPAVYRRYTSAVYEDKYFPEKNAAIPFKWETTPGTPKDDADHQYNEAQYSAAEYQHDKGNESDASCMHNMIRDHICTNYCRKDAHHLHGSCIQLIPHAVTIYPLRPPPKLSPVSRLHIKDILHQAAGDVGYHDLFDDEDDDDDHCPLHAYHHSFLRLSFPFRSIKASAVVPIHKNSVIKPRRSAGFDKAQASALLVSGPSQGRSKSFSHSACMHREPTAKQANCKALVDASTLAKVSGRRCNSFHLQSADHHAVIAQIKNDNDGDDNRSIAVAAMWTGACILAAAAAHNMVVSGDDNHHNPCKVAMKLRDLMQQSANFSELELPSMMRIKNGGPGAIDENPAQLAFRHAAATTVSAKRRAKSMEEEVMEAFLGEGMMKSCTQEKDGVQDKPKKEKVSSSANDDDDKPHKLVKSKGFFKLFKSECIACWCPSSTQY